MLEVAYNLVKQTQGNFGESYMSHMDISLEGQPNSFTVYCLIVSTQI